MKHVIITGGAGFIGSHLSARLLALGYAVTAVDNFCTGSRHNVEHLLGKKEVFHLLPWDVCRPLPLEEMPFVTRYGLHGIFHFACPASPVDFDKIPFEILAVDSLGTQNTVDLALRYDARYVVASTSEIYGDPLEHPQKEEYWGNVNTIGPRACYDETKRFAEAFVSTAIRGVGTWNGRPYKKLNGGMVRIFNTYGPRMRPDDGRVVPELCMQALEGRDLTLHGEGEQTRSFCYVSDLVDGIIRYYESRESEPINIGNPVERTVADFARTVILLTGAKSGLKKLPSRPDDPRRRCPDITRARTRLGWEPKVGLEEGLRRTLEYFARAVTRP